MFVTGSSHNFSGSQAFLFSPAESTGLRLPDAPAIMVVVYVKLYTSLTRGESPLSRIYALLLPTPEPTVEWKEINVRPSPLGGYGVFPATTTALRWTDVRATPVLLPYLGVETVVKEHAITRTNSLFGLVYSA